MGQEITRTDFSEQDFARFATCLAEETGLAGRWLAEGRFQGDAHVAGFELEAWLLDHNAFPLPANEAYLARLADPLVVPELSRFNVELNGTPQALAGRALRRMEEELARTWHECLRVAHELEGTLIMIGILPTVRQRDLTLANVSPLNRYYALNQELLRRRQFRPLQLDIQGREHLRITHEDVMLEAATTSFQVHLQAPAADVCRCYNASVILSAPLVALAANSPFLFARDLWDETRIALFEQAVDSGEGGLDAHRVTFGSGYLDGDPVACYRENLERYPVLLPILYADGRALLRHLRLHNGTIWRWNRLLVGFEGGRPHLRVEQRVMPAGPTIRDMIANAAVYLGAARFLAALEAGPEADLPFELARANFYAAARDGLAARIVWLDGRPAQVADVLLDEILPMARAGLRQLGVDEDDIDLYLDVAAARVRTGQNGARWQRAHAQRYGRDLFRLTADYLERQRSGRPVHEWEV
jgi:gamma-glutamylcysteine synthetase